MIESKVILQKAFKAAQTAKGKTINVYKKDGKTKVGVFELNKKKENSYD